MVEPNGLAEAFEAVCNVARQTHIHRGNGHQNSGAVLTERPRKRSAHSGKGYQNSGTVLTEVWHGKNSVRPTKRGIRRTSFTLRRCCWMQSRSHQLRCSRRYLRYKDTANNTEPDETVSQTLSKRDSKLCGAKSLTSAITELSCIIGGRRR